MSARGERTLFQHLLEAESLETISFEMAYEEVLPTETLRPIVRWAIEYFYRSGCREAPSLEALRAVEVGGSNYGNLLDDHEIPMGEDPEDTVEWAIDDLKSSYIHKIVATFNKRLATDMAAAQSDERIDVVSAYATELVGLSVSLASRATHAEIRTAMPDRLIAYEGRKEHQGVYRGLTFGMPEIDSHILGIDDGELCIVAAPPKAGKSFMAAWVAYQEWKAGRSPLLFTLENSVDVMLDRIACMACSVSYGLWQTGGLLPEHEAKVRDWMADLPKAEATIYIVQPALGQRSIEHLVREAQLRDSDSLLIDQLTFVELPNPNKPKNERMGEALHTLAGMIGTGRRRLPTVLLHQINREGVKLAQKTGHLEMFHMADAAEVERTAHMVFGLYATPDDVQIRQIKLQMLAARRVPLKNWQLFWAPEVGGISVEREIQI